VSDKTPSTLLAGIAILVTRPEEQADSLSAAITAAGGQAVRFPTLAIAPPADPAAAEAAVAALPTTTGAIFISTNAAKHGVKLIQRAIGALPPTPHYLGVGPASRKVMDAAGISPIISPPTQFSSEGLLALPLLAAPLDGQHFLIFRGDGGREQLASELRHRGAKVTYVACYSRRMPEPALPLATVWQRPGFDWITATSREGLSNLLAMAPAKLQPALRRRPLIVISHALAAAAKNLGFESVHAAAESTDAGLLRKLQALVSALPPTA